MIGRHIILPIPPHCSKLKAISGHMVKTKSATRFLCNIPQAHGQLGHSIQQCGTEKKGYLLEAMKGMEIGSFACKNGKSF